MNINLSHKLKSTVNREAFLFLFPHFHGKVSKGAIEGREGRHETGSRFFSLPLYSRILICDGAQKVNGKIRKTCIRVIKMLIE